MVYKTKSKADGTVEQYKARLVARGDKQVFGEDYYVKSSAASSKHVDVKLKLVKDYAKKGTVKPVHVTNGDTVADLLTRVLNAPRIMKLRKQIGLK